MKDSPTIEAEVMPSQSQTQALTVRQESGAVAPSGLFGTVEPVAIIEKATDVATVLKAVITKQGLISRISGKEYPKCEAWTLLGTMLGVFPVLCWSRPVDSGWEARVEARTRDGSIVGAAEAQCLRAEKNWQNRDDFALRSMAQTRATAKCLRMPLGFVMTLAGYEATPAEEMVSDHPHNTPQMPRQGTGATSRPVDTPQAPKVPASPAPATAKPLPLPTEQTRTKMIAALKASPGEPNREIVTEYFRKCENPSQLMPNEELEELPLRFVPATSGQMRALSDKISGFANGERAATAFPSHDLSVDFPETKTPPKAKAIEVPRDTNVDCNSPSAPWRSFPMPHGKCAGQALADLDKNYLYGLWANFEAQESWTNDQGRVIQTKPDKLTVARKLREMLDEAGLHYQFTKKKDK